MKKMKNRMKYVITAILGVFLLISCQNEDLLLIDDVTPDGYKAIEFAIEVPDMNVVQTKAVDPDGGGVQNLTIFCFDVNGIFITTVNATLQKDGNDHSLSGKLSTKVPDHTTVLQLVGNQNLTYFQEDRFRGMSEVAVMNSIEASPGRMIYWARETMESLATHTSSDNPVKLLRNQAKITLENIDATRVNFVEKGWVVVNSNAHGTVAPYNADKGGFVRPTIDNPFVTLPDNKAKLNDFVDVRTNREEYIFETENNASDPISLIVKGSQNGGEDLYYHISLIDEQGNNIMIMRNYHYKVNIVGELYYGQPTFEEALNAPATNNVWVSISDNIAQVQDSDYILTVEKTSVVIGEDEFNLPNTYYLHYTLESKGSEPVSAADVFWMDGNDVALSAFSHSFNNQTGDGRIAITLNQMDGKQKREGTLVVKKGRLLRKIKVITVKEQKFEPAWITTNIFGGETGENITMMFTIPDECPDELLPIDVLISVDELDVRNESGMKLPIIRSGEDGYGEDNGIGYKYIYTVTEQGVQRIYLETILEHNTGNTVDVTVEAEHFVSLTKTATFQSDVDQWILLHNLRSYSAQQPADEVIYYYLVPQKINAPVELDAHLGKNIEWNADHTVYDYDYVVPGENDEFLFYSKNLNHDDSRTDLNFDFYPISSDTWATGGRVHGFKRKMDGTQGSGATYHMVTNTSKSAEIVRIASNPVNSPSVTGSGICTGAQYRSAVFELANYHPFHFSAQINDMGTIISGENEEVADIIMVEYLPNRDVNISFDVTSFLSTIRGNDNQILPESEQVSVDPFGTAFDIYIDAPMLELDKTSDVYTSGKITEDANKDGRFIYHVAAERENERSGTIAALGVDSKAVGGQVGERKVIPFKTKDIVSLGDIVISSDESKVVFYTKKFKIQNKSIEGRIQYRKKMNNQVLDIPAGAFVPFEVSPIYNRIGLVTIKENGEFELRLRDEYEYDWNTDDVKLQFIDESGVVYENVFESLSAFYSSLECPIILEEV